MQEIIKFAGNHPMLIIAWVALLGAVIFTTFQNRFSKVSDITCDEAILLINKEDAVIVDLRNRDDYCKGHIINSLNIVASNIKYGDLGNLKKTKNKPVIVVCANGITSYDSAQHLITAGFERVYVLKEGISGWIGESLPLVRGK